MARNSNAVNFIRNTEEIRQIAGSEMTVGEIRDFTARSMHAAISTSVGTNQLPFAPKDVAYMWHTGAIYAAEGFASKNRSLNSKIKSFLGLRENWEVDMSVVWKKLRVDDSLTREQGVARMQWGILPDNRISMAWEIAMNKRVTHPSEFFAVLVHEMDHVAYVFQILTQFGVATLNNDKDLHFFKTEFFARYHAANFMMGKQDELKVDWDTLFRWTGSEHDPKNGLYEHSVSLASRTISARNMLWILLCKKYGSSRRSLLNDEGQFYFEQVVAEMEDFLFAIFNVQGLETFVKFFEQSVKKSDPRKAFQALSDPGNSPELIARNPFFQTFQRKVANMASSL